jgi:hypothetical protein
MTEKTTREIYEERQDSATEIFHRLNSSTMLSGILNHLKTVNISRESALGMLDYPMVDKNIKQYPYEAGFIDYLKENGEAVMVKFDQETDSFYFHLASREEGERLIQTGQYMGYIPIRSKWSNQ